MGADGMAQREQCGVSLESSGRGSREDGEEDWGPAGGSRTGPGQVGGRCCRNDIRHRFGQEAAPTPTSSWDSEARPEGCAWPERSMWAGHHWEHTGLRRLQIEGRMDKRTNGQMEEIPARSILKDPCVPARRRPIPRVPCSVPTCAPSCASTAQGSRSPCTRGGPSWSPQVSVGGGKRARLSPLALPPTSWHGPVSSVPSCTAQ